MPRNEIWKNYASSKSPELKEQIVLEHIYLVQRIANKVAAYLPPHISRDDLNSNGIFGLLEAVERYNPDWGVPFPAFASKRIRGAIIDALRREDWIPAALRKKAKLVEDAYYSLESTLGRNASDEEIANYLDITPGELQEWLKNIQFISIISLDEPLNDGEEGVFRDQVTDPSSPNPAVISEANDLKKILAKAVSELPEKERTVISLFYYNDLSNKEIAQVMELSDSRISQLHTKAIFRLRGKLSRQKKNL